MLPFMDTRSQKSASWKKISADFEVTAYYTLFKQGSVIGLLSPIDLLVPLDQRPDEVLIVGPLCGIVKK